MQLDKLEGTKGFILFILSHLCVAAWDCKKNFEKRWFNYKWCFYNGPFSL